MPPWCLTKCNVARQGKVPGRSWVCQLGGKVDLSRILGGFGFSEGPLRAATPEEARGKINYRGPQGEQGATAGQKKQDSGDTFKCIRQTADGGASKLCSDGFGDRRALLAQGERDVCERDAAAGSKALRFDSLDFTAHQGNL